jgi:ankyrin repeat protein
MAQMLEHAAAVKHMDIFQASYAGETERVAQLLNEEPERSKLESYGVEFGFGGEKVTAIQIAANAEVVRLLVKAGADVNRRTTTFDDSALDIAVSRNHVDAAQALISNGAKIDRDRILGESPLLRSCSLQDDAMMAMLLDAGADPNATSGIYGYNALAQIVVHDEHCSELTQRRIKLLLDHKGDKDRLVDTGITPLDIAIQKQNPELIAFLRNLGFHARKYN